MILILFWQPIDRPVSGSVYLTWPSYLDVSLIVGLLLSDALIKVSLCARCSWLRRSCAALLLSWLSVKATWLLLEVALCVFDCKRLVV